MREQIIEILMRAYVELNKLHAQPGEKCYMLANSIQFIERQLKALLNPPISISGKEQPK